MEDKKRQSFFVVGLALFSMFFGSGNLIFPLFIGETASHSVAATLGFLTTACLLPFLGVVTMVVFEGSESRFFRLIGRPLGLLLTIALLTVWIPLGSGPRCIALAYSSLSACLALPSIWIFGLIYSLILYAILRQESQILNILGKILTPLLLSCLGILFWKGMDFSLFAKQTAPTSSFFLGLKEGYNTMDLIAAFFFSSSVIHILRKSSRSPVKKALQASIVGTFLLATVYIGLIFLAAQNASVLGGVPKEQLLAHIANHTLGPELGIIAATAIVLACFTTSAALAIVFNKFLRETDWPWVSTRNGAMAFTLGTSLIMSTFGLEGITRITAPILQICYPLLLGMIAIQLAKATAKYFSKELPSQSDA